MTTEVKMLRTFRAAPDGINVEDWREGSTKSVDDHWLQILIGEGACEIVNKAKSAPPENKKRQRKK